MLQKEENFLTMANATLKVLQNNQTIWTANAAFSALVNGIADDIAAVNEAQQGGSSVSTGATIDKENAADAAITHAAKLSKLAQVYALEQNNLTLHDQLKVSKTSLDRLGDAELTAALQKLHAQLTGIGAAGEGYGITAAALSHLKDLTISFDATKNAPRLIITERKTHNTNIPSLLRHLREGFHKTDRLIHIWEDDQPEFLSNYNNARIIIDLGVRHEKKAAQ